MLDKSKYYIISGMMITIFQQTDKLMLKNMVGNEITGYYSAAVTCAGIFGFVYAAMIDSMRPEILKCKKKSVEQYEQSISLAYSVTFYVSLLQCVVTTLLAKPMIYVLYGEEYLPAVAALRVVVWFITYAYFGTIRGIWILAEEKYKYVLWIDVSGAIFNIILNLLIIPLLGLLGASLASVASQFFMNFVLGFFIKPLRRNNILMLKGLTPKFMMEQAKKILKSK
jgi:O-antigen/teichoic acid export membrane protein